MTQRPTQIDAFLSTTDFSRAQQQPLTGDASFRHYIRITDGARSAMLMDAPPERENVRPFVAIARALHTQGYSAPAILAADEEAGFLLLEDLGDDTFSRILATPSPEKEEALYEAAIDVLAQWHAPGRDTSLRLPPYDEALLMKEVELFSDWYLPQALGAQQASNLRGDYLALWQEALRAHPLTTDYFVHRDFHADNLMWLPKRTGLQRVGLLDFQDGVYGDAAYDMVSLLKDARRDVAPGLAQRMIARYLEKTGADAQHFSAAYHLLGAQRNSKIIGIFVRLSARDGKHGYKRFLPRVWAHLQQDLTHPLLTPLREWLDAHLPAEAR